MGSRKEAKKRKEGAKGFGKRLKSFVLILFLEFGIWCLEFGASEFGASEFGASEFGALNLTLGLGFTQSKQRLRKVRKGFWNPS